MYVGIYEAASYELGFEKELIQEYCKYNDIKISELYIDKEKEELTNKLKDFSRKYKLTKLINKNLKK